MKNLVNTEFAYNRSTGDGEYGQACGFVHSGPGSPSFLIASSRYGTRTGY